ncbi:MAG: wax ester/triacylglycerol synthase family O-acyltransferase [Acidimicrobiia bacterium]
MQRLSRTDAGFMAAETADWHMHVALVGRFNPDDDLSLAQLRELVARRFVHLALFRRRLRTVPGHLDRGVWEDVDHVDVGAHVPRPPSPRRATTSSSAAASARS